MEIATTERLQGLIEKGQSYWLDNLTREMLHNGELKQRVESEGLRGVTSNPKTFSDSVQSGGLYDSDIERLASEGVDDESIYETLMVDDVRDACDVFKELHEKADGQDGYVSIEVDPRLAHDSDGTLQAARDLWKKVRRENAMIKIPATSECLPAIEEALYEGINVNITLIFSRSRYREVAACYLRALRRREREGKDVNRIASVASFFLSRIDAKVDEALEKPGMDQELVSGIKGRIAIAQAKLAYRDFQETFTGTVWREGLHKKGALSQRLLWASTSVKSKEYPDTYYVDSLIGKETVTTLPEKTALAFSERGSLEENSVLRNSDEYNEICRKLDVLGISTEQVFQELEAEGIKKFIEPFEVGLKSISRLAKQTRGAAV